MLTGQQEETDIIKSLDTGANDYIAKPIRFGELLARIRSSCASINHLMMSGLQPRILNFSLLTKPLTALDSQRVVVLTEKETMILKKLFRYMVRVNIKGNAVV